MSSESNDSVIPEEAFLALKALKDFEKASSSKGTRFNNGLINDAQRRMRKYGTWCEIITRKIKESGNESLTIESVSDDWVIETFKN